VQPEGIAEDGVPVYHLQKIYVLPSEQGKGLGKLLFKTAVDYIRSQVPDLPFRIELNVNRNNKAVDFYKHLGMSILRQGDFHIGNGFYMNDYIMGMDVER
jgi:GNAT superfamily N-acetyltransferase